MYTVNFQMSKLDLEKAEEPEVKLPTSVGSLRKQENSRKTSLSALLTIPKPLTVWITTNCGKFFKRWEYKKKKKKRDGNTKLPYLPSENFYMQVKKQQNHSWHKGLVPNWERIMSRLYIITLLI